jgi:hypothetical protein
MMFRLLIVLLVIAACIAALGHYRSWFHVESDKPDGNSRITITTDNEQIKKDKNSIMEHMPGAGTPSKNVTPARKGQD